MIHVNKLNAEKNCCYAGFTARSVHVFVVKMGFKHASLFFGHVRINVVFVLRFMFSVGVTGKLCS